MPYTVLPNGLTVVTDPMAHVETTSLGVWVGTGVRSEADGEHGVAHFLEHMAFKGTAKRSARAISEAIETVGGEINAATSVETTAYHCRVLAQDAPLALDILADILTAPQFAPDEVRRERGVILQEIAAAEDVPEDVAFDAFPETAFVGQPVGRRILGTRDSVAVIERDTLAAFFARHYTAGALTVAAAGAIDHDWLVKAVGEAFASVPAAPAPAPDAARYTGGTFHDPSEEGEVQFILGLAGYGARQADAAAAHVAAMVLGGGLSSRLFQALREDRGLVYDTSAFHWAFQDTGVFALHLATSAETIDEAVAVALGELADAAGAVGDDELHRAKAQLRAGLLMARESSGARMGQAARQAMVFGRQLTREERLAELDAVTTADVCRILSACAASAPTVVSVGPKAVDEQDVRLRLDARRAAA